MSKPILITCPTCKTQFKRPVSARAQESARVNGRKGGRPRGNRSVK